ncbi:MAG: hypothetical protein L6367_03250 [Cellulomonas sp.]|nr:hypothetical protein [Cellulomonas sp.]
MDTSLGDRAAPATPPSPAATTIRMAGIEDITVIARITQEGPQRSNLDPELVARTTRLLLTHVAFEHGALWVELGGDGRIARAVAVIPGTDVTPWTTLGRVVGSDLPATTPQSPEETELGRAFAAELTRAAPSWVLSEISRTEVDAAGRVALLEAALDWARRQCVEEPGSIALVADSQPEAQAAQDLGFIELHASDSEPGLWLGLAPSRAVPPPGE